MANSSIGANTVLKLDVTIGTSTSIGQNAVVCRGAKVGSSVILGSNVLIQSNTVAEDGVGVTAPARAVAPLPGQCTP